MRRLRRGIGHAAAGVKPRVRRRMFVLDFQANIGLRLLQGSAGPSQTASQPSA